MDTEPAPDRFDLGRFVRAQDAEGVFERALRELRSGRKTSHWMWFIFPQIAGLGRSAMAVRYAIASSAEAGAYLRHQVLGPRLVTCAEALLMHRDLSAEAILGGIDAVKLRSSMTLFAHADPEVAVFGRVLEAFFDGSPDPVTEQRLR